MSAPDWLTSDYFAQILRNFHNDNELYVIELHMQPALGKGENYGAVLTRLTVKYQRSSSDKNVHTQHLIVKSALDNENAQTKQLKAPYDVFNREMTIYAQILPKLQQLLRGITDCEQLFPTAIYVDRLHEAIIFEDLTASGFQLADRLKCLNVTHIKLILRKLAKLHATTAVLNADADKDKDCNLERYDRGFFNKYTESYRSYFIGCLLACARYLAEQPQLAHFATKLVALSPHYMRIGLQCFTPATDDLNVLTHGDLWTNNVMFKYDARSVEPIDVLLIDFQYAFWGAPTLDLHHLFNTSMAEEALCGQQHGAMLQYYHGIFAETLLRLNYRQKRIPSLHQLHVQAEQRGFYAVHCALILRAVLLNDDPTDADFEAFLSEDERGTNFKNRLYKNPVIQRNLQWLLPLLDQKGLLDVNQ